MGIVPFMWYNGIPRAKPSLSEYHVIIPHEGYNPYILENHSADDLYHDATNQTLGVFSTVLYYAARHTP